MSNSGFQLKASSLTFTSLSLFSPNLDIIEAQLKDMTSKTPHFFDATPILIDLSLIEAQALPLDLLKLIALLRKYSLNPIALKTYDASYKLSAKEEKLAIIAQTESSNLIEEKKASQKESTEPKSCFRNTKIIDQAVRSGKQIYAKESDLIVTASISHGAEIIADGNIHIYGTLNGRALAGALGNKEARIFCKNLDAELIAIAGHYLVNEQIPNEYKNANQYLEIFLEENTLRFKSL